VEQDGSGDFTIIQDALDAAAAGDSILIGPGRFDTFRPAASTVTGFQFMCIAWVTTPNLTIIGAGKDLTIIGSSAYTDTVDGLLAAGLYLDGGCAGTLVNGIAVDNVYGPITIRDQVTLEDCRGTSSDPAGTFMIGILNGSDIIIRDCEFFQANAILTGSGADRIIVEDCWFTDDSDNGIAIAFSNGSQDCIARRCTMEGGGIGVQFHLGATGEVLDCTMSGLEANIDMSQGIATVRNCDFGPARISVRVGIGRLEVYDTIIGGGTQYTIASTGDVYVRNSHILNEGAQTVLGSSSDPGEYNDLRENWWGTADEAQIEAWITDEDGTVLWRPILEVPVTASETSVGQIKTRYGRQ
jgi:hypothetical protein